MNIAFFGSSLVSSYWNGAATYYRGISRALHQRGHHITFYEPDAYDRQANRDIEDPYWAEVVVYEATESAVRRAMESAGGADLIVKASGVGVFDDLLEAELLELKTPSNLVVFWDVDAPATLERISNDDSDPFLALVPRYDLIFTYGGGEPVCQAYTGFGARGCVPVYNALDPDTHYPVHAEPRYQAHAGFLGNRLPDREERVDEFFLQPAAAMPEKKFILGGAGWGDKPMAQNVKYVGHVSTRDHNAFNCSASCVLNISRASMARFGYSPATRVFEAAGAGACILSDLWDGIDQFFEPGSEILTAADREGVIERVRALTTADARSIGEAALKRALAEHTYAQRAALVESALDGRQMRLGAIA